MMEVVDTRYGKLIASRNDKYLGRGLFEYGEFSEHEVELFRQFVTKDAIVCDVGANIGAHTLAFSRIAKHVHAFEPIPTLFNAMAGMVALNGLDNVTCYQVGVGEADGVMTYPALDFDCVNNLGAGSLESFNGSRGVRVFNLDTPCHFLKVDVEGMESAVLKGAAPMIRECQPVMYVEADRKDNFPELLSVIRDLKYCAYWHTPFLFNERNFKKSTVNIFGEIASLNLLCVPFEIEGEEQARTWLNH